MKIASTKSEISKISATQTIHTLTTQISTMTQALEGLQNNLATTGRKKNRKEKQKQVNYELKEKRMRRETEQNKRKEEKKPEEQINRKPRQR